MKEQKSRLLTAALWIILVLWLSLLVWLSSQQGPASTRTSMAMARLVVGFLGLSQDRLSQVNHTLRLFMHFAGYFVLGGLAYPAFLITWPEKKRRRTEMIAICGMAAVLDEVKKVMISGRHLSWPEAGLNVLGVLCGVLTVYGAICLRTHRKPSG